MKELEQNKDYQEIHEKYQAVAKEQPPQSLDASILQAAHLAVEKPDEDKPAVNKPAVDKPAVDQQGQNQSGIDTQSVKRAWYVPVSYVAILVISLSVVMKLALEPEMFPMTDENEPFDMSEDYSMAVEQDVAAPLTTLAESPPAKRKLAKSAPARINQQEVSREENRQQRLNELKQTMQKRQASRAEVNKDIDIQNKVIQDKIIHQQKSDKARSRQMLSSSQEEETKNEQAAVAPVVAPSLEPAAEISIGANASLNYMSGINAEKALSDQLSHVNAVKNNKQKEITLKQQLAVKKLVDLYEKKQYKELKLALNNYRKDYPVSEKPEALPENLLDWEKENISRSSKK